MRLIKLSFVIIAFSFVLPNFAFAQADEQIDTGSGREVVENVNSFELFWPLVAGKTKADGFTYTLKLLKERLRGFFIFGPSKKLDYKIFRAAKRLLESEYLMEKGEMQLASDTLRASINEINSTLESIRSMSSKGVASDQRQNMLNRLPNIRKLSWWLSSQNDDLNDSLTELNNKAQELYDLLDSL